MKNDEGFNNFIRFSDQKDYIENRLYQEEWVTVYQLKKIEESDYMNDICFYSCLVSEERKKKDYKKDSQWIMKIDSGRPFISHKEPLNLINQVKQKLFRRLIGKFYQSNLLWKPEQLKKNSITFKIKIFFFNQLSFLFNYEKQVEKYQRFSEEGIEPLVHIRYFNNYSSYIEISEEFRHYFNLYEDRNKNIFLSSDENGNPIEVIKVIDNDRKREVQIKKKYLNEFLFVKKMWLCIQFDHRRWVNQSLLKESIVQSYQSPDGSFIYSLNSGNNKFAWNGKIFIRFMGKKFIKYKKPKFLWYEKEKKYEEFSFIDENGEEEIFTCEESKLANLYGKNKDSPNYLTLISFCKDVLKKYYDKPDQYSVSDRHLKCEGFWSMEIDILNNRVSVFLGDLSKLPYKEQKYWRSYNITEKARISRVNWERSFECKFTETDRPDFLFKKRYHNFNENWNKKYEWFFFKPLSEKDKSCFDSLRIPLDEEQQEFDNQVQNLTKIFIESINIKEIKKTFLEEYEKNSKTIDILEQCLKVKDSPMIRFLRNLQKLRSKGSAHIETDKEYIKVLDYFKNLEGIKQSDSKIEIFSQILIRCIWTISFLERCFFNDKDSK